MSRGFEDLFGPSFLDDPFAPRRLPVRRPSPVRPAPVRRGPAAPPRQPAERGVRHIPVDPRVARPESLTDFDRPVDDVDRSRVGRTLRGIDGGRQQGAEDAPRSSEPAAPPDLLDEPTEDDRAGDVARAAIARAEAKLSFDEELARAKRRFEREAEREVTRQRRETITPFLEVLDDVDRALAAADDTTDGMRQGVQMIRDRFLDKLREQGVTPMAVEGEPFDPTRHEAMSVVPVADPALDNTVVGVIRAGYALDDDVLRPAGVAVGRTG